MEWISLLWIGIGDLAISTLGNHCGNSRSLSQFSTSQLFSHEATFFVAKIFDNVKYKKHVTNEIRSSHSEVLNVFLEILQNSVENKSAIVSFLIK